LPWCDDLFVRQQTNDTVQSNTYEPDPKVDPAMFPLPDMVKGNAMLYDGRALDEVWWIGCADVTRISDASQEQQNRWGLEN